MYSILMVDDEHPILKARAGFLMQQGCVVHCVTTADQAVGMVKVNPYDCILLDVMLSEITGFALCTALRELTDAPIIFLSSLTDDESQLEGFLSGGVDYITKNVSLPLFWTKIETRIRLSHIGKQTLVYPPLTIDLAARRVYLEKEEIIVTSLEFDILALIAEKPRQIFSVSAIYRAVWGAEPLEQGQTVQVHLSHMRRKLEKAFPRHYFIETVWGKGYQFIPTDE